MQGTENVQFVLFGSLVVVFGGNGFCTKNGGSKNGGSKNGGSKNGGSCRRKWLSGENAPASPRYSADEVEEAMSAVNDVFAGAVPTSRELSGLRPPPMLEPAPEPVPAAAAAAAAATAAEPSGGGGGGGTVHVL